MVYLMLSVDFFVFVLLFNKMFLIGDVAIKFIIFLKNFTARANTCCISFEIMYCLALIMHSSYLELISTKTLAF